MISASMMVSAVAQVTIGVIAGFFFIFISHAIIAPRVQISQDIRTYWGKARKNYIYQVKINKTGIIDLIDCRIQCKMYILNLYDKNEDSWEVYRIPTSISETLVLSRRPVRFRLQFYEAWQEVHLKNPTLLSKTKIHLEESGIRLEDLFMSFESVYIKIFILGVDRLTGVVKLFESSKYCVSNIRYGDWDGMIVKEPRLNKS